MKAEKAMIYKFDVLGWLTRHTFSHRGAFGWLFGIVRKLMMPQL